MQLLDRKVVICFPGGGGLQVLHAGGCHGLVVHKREGRRVHLATSRSHGHMKSSAPRMRRNAVPRHGRVWHAGSAGIFRAPPGLCRRLLTEPERCLELHPRHLRLRHCKHR